MQKIQVKSVANLLDAANKIFDTPPELIKSGQRWSPLVEVRQVLHFVAFVKMDSKCTSVGILLNKNHATILYSRDKVWKAIHKHDTQPSELSRIYHKLMTNIEIV